MKFSRYVVALLFIVSFPTIQSMNRSKIIKEIGQTADIDTAQLLLNQGMDVNTPGLLNYSMLLHAVSDLYEKDDNVIDPSQRLEFIAFLIKRGAHINPQTSQWTQVPILQATASKIAPQIISLLIQNGADVNTVHDGHSALDEAACNGRCELVEFLLNQENINIDIQDNVGRTPLINAAYKGHAKIVELLLKHGADTTIRDHYERTALDTAILFPTEDKERSSLHVIKLLISNNIR